MGSKNKNDKFLEFSPNKNKNAKKNKKYDQLNKGKGQENAMTIEHLIGVTNFQQPSTSEIDRLNESEEVTSDQKNLSIEKVYF